jgi:hypothetical protein
MVNESAGTSGYLKCGMVVGIMTKATPREKDLAILSLDVCSLTDVERGHERSEKRCIYSRTVQRPTSVP